MFTIEKILDEARNEGATDVYLMTGSIPKYRKAGKIKNLNYPKLTEEDMKKITINMMGELQREQFRVDKETIFAYETQNGNRYRVNIFRQNELITASIRCVNNNIKDVAISEEIMALAEKRSGIVVIAGSAGAGKSTLLNAIVTKLNSDSSCSIVSIENPVEYIYKDGSSFVIQRCIGQDVRSYAMAVKNSLKINSDIIIIDEISDEETMKAALDAAMAGAFVLTTIDCAEKDMVNNRINGLCSESAIVKKYINKVIFASVTYENQKSEYIYEII